MIETVMTREQWEMEYERRYREKRRQQMNAIRMMILQKLCGILLIAMGFIFAYIFLGEDNGTGALLLWFIGGVLLFCPKQVFGT